jgi:hypothetical protein
LADRPAIDSDETAKAEAAAFARKAAQWDGPKLAAEKLVEHYAGIG